MRDLNIRARGLVVLVYDDASCFSTVCERRFYGRRYMGRAIIRAAQLLHKHSHRSFTGVCSSTQPSLPIIARHPLI